MSSSGAFWKYNAAIYMFCFVCLLVGLQRDSVNTERKTCLETWRQLKVLKNLSSRLQN